MASAIGQIRNAVYDAILAAKPGMVITDFDLVKTYYPKTELQTLVKPIVYVVPLQWTQAAKLSRAATRQADFPIQVATQAKVVPTDFEGIDVLIDFVDELHGIVAEVDPAGFSWTGTQGQQDPNGTPLTFVELHERHLFQSIITATYTAIIC